MDWNIFSWKRKVLKLDNCRLPVPWLLQFAIRLLTNSSSISCLGAIPVISKGLICSVSLLFLMLIVLIVAVRICRWEMNKVFGIVMIVAYVKFCLLSVLLELGYIVCPFAVACRQMNIWIHLNRKLMRTLMCSSLLKRSYQTDCESHLHRRMIFLLISVFCNENFRFFAYFRPIFFPTLMWFSLCWSSLLYLHLLIIKFKRPIHII